ncbi:MAG: dihydrolipoyl dehydrogenase [Planctomycetes bacterium]|nr:dihydrolipoyl dehydrogenase [Planctomycetota bacterium]
MADVERFDLLVIGGGPAGYVGAIRAAQLGMKVGCVERDKLGGICNNWGCIPTKALLAGAEFYNRLRHEAGEWGIAADNIRHDWSKVIARSRGVADTGARGVGSLFKKHKIAHLQGHARITSDKSPFTVEVHDKPDHVAQTVQATRLLVCTGAQPRELPGTPFDGDRVISYKEAMSLPAQPKSLVIVGAGAIGMEFAYFYNAFGTKVTVVEMLDRLLPIEDTEVSAAILRSFQKQGIDCKPGHKTASIKKTDTGVEVVIEPAAGAGEKTTLTADKVLIAVGVKGRYDGLFAPSVKVETFKDHIKVDYKKPGATYETSVKGIFAVGDVIGPPWLAHLASEEAVVCVERIAGHKPVDIDYDAVPGCTYCVPQVASLGKTEQALQAEGKKAGVDYKVGKFPFMASGKARAAGHTEGFVKIISDAKYGEILGVHMIGDNVTELLAEMGLAKRLEATVEEIIETLHAHPTLSEAVHEAALGTQGRMIHL